MQLERGRDHRRRGRDRCPQGPARRLPGAAGHLPGRGRAGRRARLRRGARRERRARRRLLADPRAPSTRSSAAPATRKSEDATSRVSPRPPPRATAAPSAAARDRALDGLDGFTAAPFTPEEQARRAQQLIRFLDLVPVEYDHGTDDGEVTLAFEIQEAIAFTEGAQSAFNDLESRPAGARPRGRPRPSRPRWPSSTRSPPTPTRAARSRPLDEVERSHDEASDALDAMFPDEWKESDTEADFDLVEISLDQMEAAVSAGEREQAEQARLSAYAFFEFGPERLLRGLDPQLTPRSRGWSGTAPRGKEGLAELIADDGSARDVRDTRLALDEALERAKGTTGEGASGDHGDHQRRPDRLPRGPRGDPDHRRDHRQHGRRQPPAAPADPARRAAGAARERAPVRVAVLLLDQLSQYGEKLEAVVGLVAIGVLLLVLNWFFHRVYWTEWIAGHRKRGKALAGAAAGGAVAGATVLGLYVLGFTSVFREGFETVLFLQALQLEAGTGIVLAGVGARAWSVVAARRRGHLQARAAPALQADADRHRRADRARPGGHGRQHRAHAAGRRLALDHPDRHRVAAVDGHLARRSSRPGRRSAPSRRPSPS